MKTVFSNHDECAHIWASQSQYEGRASRVFFEGQTIYSYGRHFPVARFAPEYGNVVLFTDRGYSNSTAKHKSLIRLAIPSGFDVIYCNDPTRSVEHNLSQWQHKAEYLRRDFAVKKHKISRGNLAVEIFQTCEAATVFCHAVGVPAPDWTAETSEEMTARDYVYELAKARAEKREAAEAERKRLAAIKSAERLQLWLAGESVPLDGFHYHDTVLRLKGDKIETSRGANIPVSDALTIWPLLLRAKNTGKTLEAGLRTINLGPYRFNSFDGETLTVGCHSIAWPELEKMATQLNLIEKAAA